MARKGQGIVGPHPVKLPGLHRGQERVLREAKQENYLCAGRGWWKSSLMIRKAWEGLENGKFVLWTCFTSEPIDIVIEELWKSKVLGQELWDKCFHESKRILYLPDKPPLRFASLTEAQNQRGGTPDLVIVDEGGEIARGDMQRVIEPFLFKSDGELWVVGTPNAKDPLNDFYEKLTSDKIDLSYTSRWIIPVVGAYVDKVTGQLIRKVHEYENPHYGFQRLKKSWDKCLPSQKKSWEVEYLCEFINAAGALIENPEKVCVLPFVRGEKDGEFLLPGYRSNPSRTLRAGMDIGLSENPTVISIMDEEMKRQVYMRRFTPRSHTKEGKWQQLYDAVERCYRLYGSIDSFDVDVTKEGSHLVEIMNARGFEITGYTFSGTAEKKMNLYAKLQDSIEGGHIQLFDEKQIKQELSVLQKTPRGEGKWTIAAPKGEFDDIPAALALMLKDAPNVEGEKQEADIEELTKLYAAANRRREAEEAVSFGSVGRRETGFGLWTPSSPF